MQHRQARSRAGAPALGTVLVCSALVALAVAPSASAVEAWDGRIQAHGFFEFQLRAIDKNFGGDIDLTQWYNVFNLELEFDLIEQPIGPVDLVQAFVRTEVRYDCVWTRACGLFPSANTFGDRADNLPERLSNAQTIGATGAINRMTITESLPDGTLIPLPDTPAFAAFAGTPENVRYLLASFADFKFAAQKTRSGANFGFNNLTMGPWLPRNFIHANAAVADRINPFDNSTLSPPARVAGAPSGLGALPFRPIPVASEGAVNAAGGRARGLYLPSSPLRDAIARDQFDDVERLFNFRQAEREWNRGESQQQTKELKEAYFEAEMFDSQLYMRIGRQSIIWGKTELFRTTDQFNPTDIALASLPSLEESRIPLWSAKFIWSVWDHPLPVEDLRFELAFNFDQFQQVDLGACGEPYTPDPVCGLTGGIFAHGLTGLGVAGIDTPPSPWEDISGLEIGGRIEWRWDRFSFALMDFWGYSDGPYAKRITTFERNVDPRTGAPRVLGSRGNCALRLVGTAYVRPNNGHCLQPGPTFRASNGGTPPGANTSFPASQANVPNNALDEHYANQQLFAVICSVTVGFTDLDPASCAINVFGSPAPDPITGLIPIGVIIGGVLAGNPGIHNTFAGALMNQGVPIVALTQDSTLIGAAAAREEVPGAPAGSPQGIGALGPTFALASALTPEQEALLGCGPWFGTNCDNDGIDLLNAEASVLVQSMVGFDGTGPDKNYVIPYVPPGGGGPDNRRPQPGHVGFQGGPVCTIGLLATGSLRGDTKLPGCRGPGRPGYNQGVDGSVAGIGYFPAGVPLDAAINFQGAGAQNPLHGQTFANEMAAISWNFMMLLVATSPEFNGNSVASSLSTRPGKCSYRQPQFCTVLQAIFAVAEHQRNTIEAGGNGQFGRRTFWWHSGGEVILAFDKRNVLGFSLDLAEDRTKTNWNVEFTWIEGLLFGDSEELDGIRESDTINLTVSVDRSTFINFLNQNRTFLINTQWFFQYIPDHRDSFSSNGPINVLFTVAIATAYFQDRLAPSAVFVWDVNSGSGAAIAQIGYRFNERFSLSLGTAFFTGRTQLRDMSVNPIGITDNQVGEQAYRVGVDNGLSAIRDRDEFFARLRYTF